MAKQYYVKKNPDSTGADIEWNALTGQEFYRLITSPAGKGRYFIDMDNFMIEANKEQYIEWRREKDHSDYLREQEEGHSVLSIYSDLSAETRNGEEIIPDTNTNVEAEALRAVEYSVLRTALGALDEKSYRLISALYSSEKEISERALATEMGLPQSTVNKRKKKILKNLKFVVVKLKKSSQ